MLELLGLLVALEGNMMPVQAASSREESVSMPKEIPKNISGEVPPEHRHASEEAAMPYPPEPASGCARQSQIESIRQRHEGRLMAIEGVIGVGVGRTPTGDDAIILYLRDASVKNHIPVQVEGYPVETTVTGEIDAHHQHRP